MHAVIKMELKCAGEELVVPSVLPPVGFVVAVDVEMISVVISVLAIAVEVDSELLVLCVVIEVEATVDNVGSSVRCVGSKSCNKGPRSGSSEKTISSTCSNRSNTTLCNKITCNELN